MAKLQLGQQVRYVSQKNIVGNNLMSCRKSYIVRHNKSDVWTRFRHSSPADREDHLSELIPINKNLNCTKPQRTLFLW
jgi:hypothetical protein